VNKITDEVIFIGQKEIKNYISACFFGLGKEDKIVLKARGKNSITALNVLAILIRDYLENPVYNIVVGSEQFKNPEDDRERWVTTVEIELSGLKKEKDEKK